MTKKKLRSKLSKQQLRRVIFIAIFVLIGTSALLLTRAATSSSSIEPEMGVTTPPASPTSLDSTASNNSAIKFGTIATQAGIVAEGKLLKKNGATFYPKGFNTIGVLQPDNCPRKKGPPTTAAANLNQSEMTAAKNTWSANTIRFQVSQKGLDPQDSELKSGQAAYLTKIKNAVTLAQSNGMTVILSMQDQVYSCGFAHPLPSSETKRAWQTLAPLYSNDPSIIFELFNEPVNQTSDADWAQWRNGGTTPTANTGSDGSNFDVVGHQTLLTTIRAAGAKNVVFASGANKGGKLQGLWQSSTKNYFLTDTLATPQVGYVIHPYYFHTSNNSTLASDTNDWENRFGYMRNTSIVPADKQVPMIATEWNASSNCYTGQTGRTTEFLNYLKAKDIGLTGHALDIAGLLVTNVPGWQPSSFTTGGTECGAGSDAGTAMQTFFKNIP